MGVQACVCGCGQAHVWECRQVLVYEWGWAGVGVWMGAGV